MRQEILLLGEISNKVSLQVTKIYDLEQEKRQALLSYNMNEVDRIMKSQQALTMQLDTLEKTRVIAQNDAGFANMNTQQILDTVSRDEWELLSPIFETLTNIATQLKSINRISMEIAASELRVLSQGAPVTTSNSLYSPYKKSNGRTFASASFEGKV